MSALAIAPEPNLPDTDLSPLHQALAWLSDLYDGKNHREAAALAAEMVVDREILAALWREVGADLLWSKWKNINNRDRHSALMRNEPEHGDEPILGGTRRVGSTDPFAQLIFIDGERKLMGRMTQANCLWRADFHAERSRNDQAYERGWRKVAERMRPTGLLAECLRADEFIEIFRDAQGVS